MYHRNKVIIITLKNNIMTTLKTLTVLVTILISTLSYSQQTETVEMGGISWEKESVSFNNVFELKETKETYKVNLSIYTHAFKVVNNYSNVIVIKIVNGSYKEAFKVRGLIKDLNKSKEVKFI